MNETSDDPLVQNCRPDWQLWTCIGANVCGLCSTTLWFFVLLPQVRKNYRRKSMVGLSVLWGTANFTASLINFCFVYGYADVPLYGKINSVYMPVLEFIILVQFWIYGHQYSKRRREIYAIVCFGAWTTLISVNLGFRLFPYIQWIAIFLWCIETFPQVFLNFKLGSTSGQSTRSVIITSIGKMTDFLATYGLRLPVQYVVMTYFSSSVAYVNLIQVVWYYRRDIHLKPDSTDVQYDKYNESDDKYNESDDTDEENKSICNTNRRYFSNRTINIIRLSMIITFFCILTFFAFGLIWATDSCLGLLGPVGILVVTGSALLRYRRPSTRRANSVFRSFSCAYV